MAAGPVTLVSDVVVPRLFSPYVQQLTEEKSRLVRSGVLARSEFLDMALAGGGLTFDVPSFRDLDSDADRVSTDTAHAEFGGAAEPDPFKIETSQEVAVRLSRNGSWSSSDLTGALAGRDPMEAIASRVSEYWARRLQQIFIATINGVILDNTANDSGDYTNDVSGAAFQDGVTNFTPEAFIDTALTMGDSMDDVTVMFVHSVVKARMQKLNLIDFIPDSEGRIAFETYLNRLLIVDDTMPRTGSVYDSWLFGAGAVQMGMGSPKVPTEVERKAGAGNGGGQEVLYNRNEYILHPVGHAYTGTAPSGGPSNAATTNNLAIATSWNRVYPDRKQIKFARLVTREA